MFEPVDNRPNRRVDSEECALRRIDKNRCQATYQGLAAAGRIDENTQLRGPPTTGVAELFCCVWQDGNALFVAEFARIQTPRG